ncbi:type II secretory pathway pseudopilin PulG [Edaphobacter lichenicola]|uniref:Type II secretory pathway pseudopilin PulG n=1 Tax=Tunturiibacter empetritectus TaxID=3069691 RepID=A0A7W8IL98_9BACT|nr:type II secretory pathway pseudopilin PulG [Edaphobacter lichenicola]
MKLLLKFNLIVLAVVAIGLAIVSWVAHSFLIDNARAQVLQQAELIIRSASSTRDYTTEELTPIIVTAPAMRHTFLPQAIPFYGATVTFAHLRQKFPEYMYRKPRSTLQTFRTVPSIGRPMSLMPFATSPT